MEHAVVDNSIVMSLITLTVMEIILGIDNVVFISLIAGKLPEEQQRRARMLGLGAALGLRLVMLATLVWLVGLTKPVFTLFGEDFSWRDIILIVGGLFLLYKGTHEIHTNMEEPDHLQSAKQPTAFSSAVIQIILIDLVFSVDSVITAVGMAEHLWVMVVAVIIAMIVMFVASGAIAGFLKAHPTTKMLALSFLLLIGMALVADGLGMHIPKPYIYFSMAFAFGVEVLNILASRARRKGRAAQGQGGGTPPAQH